MPTTTEILSGLIHISNQYLYLAMAWHLVFYILLIALLSRKTIPRLLPVLVLSPAMLSVSVLAWTNGNPFNGAVFAVLFLLFLTVGLFGRSTPGRNFHSAFRLGGFILLAYGFLYPHFLVTEGPLMYFIASPAGLIPCPTLSVIIGFALISDGFRSKALSIILTVAGLFYSLFGMFRLGVMLDLGLLFGSLLLAGAWIIRGQFKRQP